MEQTKLNEILRLHKLWLDGNEEGKRANLHRADLRDANLQYANLRDANLRGADLRDANLRDANLRGADLRDANLRGANLQYANLRDANLRDANLRGADLHRADLRGANLQDANLRDANLNFSCLPLWCGSLQVHFDDKQIIQLIYHVLSTAQYSKNVSGEIKEVLLSDKLIDLANKFHVAECPRLAKERIKNDNQFY